MLLLLMKMFLLFLMMMVLNRLQVPLLLFSFKQIIRVRVRTAEVLRRFPGGLDEVLKSF